MSRRDERLDAEVQHHLEQLAAEYERGGMTPEDARLAARRAFGGVQSMKEQHRDARGLRWLDDLQQDVRYALRSLRRTPGFALACTAMLTLGIGLNLALFQLVNVTTLQPLDVKDPGTLVRFYRRGRQITSSTLPYPATQFVAAHQNVLAGVLTQSFGDVSWEGNAGHRLRASFVSANWFEELGYGALHGRVFREGIDDRPGAAPAVVLSHAFWRASLGSDPRIVGSTVQVNDRTAQVLGVLPANFPGLRLRDVQVWMPVEHIEHVQGAPFTTSWTSSAEFYGRLRDGVSLPAAKEGLRAAMRELGAQQPDVFGSDEWLEPYSARVRFETPRDRRERIAMALAAMALTLLVLMIACANLGNLVLSRAGERLTEISIRTALGASRLRVIRQSLTETLILAVAGAAGGLIVGASAADVIAAVTSMPPYLDFSPDWRTVTAALTGALIAMTGVGLFPAWKISESGMSLSLKDGNAHASSGLERARFRQVLIGVQIAGTCLLLVLAVSMLGHLTAMSPSGAGFDVENVAVLEPGIEPHGVTGPAKRAYWAAVRSAVGSLPATEAVTLVTPSPLGPSSHQVTYPGIGALQVTLTYVEPEFFSVMHVPLVAGRTFRRDDDPNATVIISRRLALAMYGSLNVVGATFPRIAPEYAARFAAVPRRTVVGVAGDAKLIRITASDGAEQYVPLDVQHALPVALLARARTDAAPLLAPMRQAARAADARVRPETRLMRGDFETRLAPLRIGSSVAAALAVLALSLACIGVFAVIAHAATRRTREIGIRVTLGAPRASILATLLRQLFWPTTIGLVVGLGAAAPMLSFFGRDPFFLPTFDLTVHAIVVLSLLATVGVAAASPAVRALRTDPVKALRYE